MGIILGVAFSILFLVVGVLRVVEIRAIELTGLKRKVLTVGHLIGCLLFSAALALTIIDLKQNYKVLTNQLFFTGVFLLFPIHIYIGIKRKIRSNDPSFLAKADLL